MLGQQLERLKNWRLSDLIEPRQEMDWIEVLLTFELAADCTQCPERFQRVFTFQLLILFERYVTAGLANKANCCSIVIIVQLLVIN